MSPPSVVVVGGGFAGFYAARTLECLLPAEAAAARPRTLTRQDAAGPAGAVGEEGSPLVALRSGRAPR